MNESKWYLRTQDETFGPETAERMVEWARKGKILPGQEISDDNVVWRRVEEVPFLDMRFSIDIGDGNPRGPFNRAAAEALLASGRLPKSATMVEVREPFAEPESAAPGAVEPESSAVCEAAERPEEAAEAAEADVTVPESAVAEPPPAASAIEPEARVVEKVVEKIVEKEVEKVVVDETRVRELEELLAEERRHADRLRAQVDEISRNGSETAKAAAEREAAVRQELQAAQAEAEKLSASVQEAADRERKYAEQIAHLEDEIRRLPQAASEVADIQVAVYSIMKNEAEELGRIIESEKREFEAAKKRHEERAEQLAERRRVMLKRAGVNIEDMTRKALIERPEDPRTVQLRHELEELRRQHEHERLEMLDQVRVLKEQLRQRKLDESRTQESMKDVTQLRNEVQTLRERLQVREQELLVERQRSEELRQQQAVKQQVLLARLATLETPSFGTAQTLSTNQSREAKQVKLPKWMRLRK